MRKLVVDDYINTDFSGVSKEECIAMIRSLYHTGKALSQKVDDQARLLAAVEEFRRMAEAKPYVPATESMQMLFDELEVTACFGKELKEETETVKGHERKKRVCRTVLPASTPVTYHDHTAGAGDTMERDGISYHRVEDTVIEKLSRVPASSTVEIHRYAAYEADCQTEKASDQKVVLFGRPGTDGLSASPSLVAGVAVAKFDDHLPLYRQEEMLARSGLNVSRQSMSRWLIAHYSGLVDFSRWLEDRIFRMGFLQQDETPVEVLDVRSKGGKVSSGCYSIIRVGTDLEGGVPRRLCTMTFSEGRSSEKLLDGYGRNGYGGLVMTDGLKGYLALPDDRHAVCLVHATRQFKQILKMDKGNADAFRICLKASELSSIDSRLRKRLTSGKISEEDFVAERRRLSEPVIGEMLRLCDDARRRWPEQGAMGKALGYMDAYRHLIPNYLKAAACPPDNNACERMAKSFATGRKNWLFSKSVDGIDASCFYYSLVESAKANGIPADLYVEHILQFGPDVGKEDYETLLPWNVDLSAVKALREERRNAKPDPKRTEPYVLTGFSR